MIRYLVPPQLRPMAHRHKMICGCAICNTPNYFQESLNSWRRKQLKTMKDKADHSRGRNKDELTQAYKSYTTTFQTMKLVVDVAKMQLILFFVHRLMMNFNCPIGNVYCRSVLPVPILLSQ